MRGIITIPMSIYNQSNLFYYRTYRAHTTFLHPANHNKDAATILIIFMLLG